MTSSVTLSTIRAAAQAIAGHVIETPCLASQTLSEVLGASIVLKFENLQFTASFKERGALNKLLSLTSDQAQAGVVAVSAGNHAQGVAYHARRLGIATTIVMPETASATKIEHVRDFGAEVILRGRTFAEASEALPELIRARKLTLVHPFDDPAVIAGQGTVALEMLAAAPDLDALVVPVGGGGLISGIAVAAKALKPGLRVIGVQSELYPGMAAALGKCPPGPGGSTIADGIAVKAPSETTRAIAAQYVDDLLTVSETAIEDAVAMLLDIEKTVCEGAAGAGIAAIRAHPAFFRGRRTGVVLSGGNIDISVLSSVLQRALVRRGRVIKLAIPTQDVPGALAQIAAVIARCGANIRHVAHERVFSSGGARDAEITFEVELTDSHVRDDIRCELQALGVGVKITP
jgi:threonine dehydratase